MNSQIKKILHRMNKEYPTMPMLAGVLGFFIGLFGILTGTMSLWYLIVAILGFFLFDSLGIQIGYHKLFSHRTFKTSRFWKRTLALLGVFAGQNTPIVWASLHRSNHHANADTECDIHSPRRGLFHSMGLWYWKVTPEDVDLRATRDLLRDPFIKVIHRYYMAIWFLGVVGIGTISMLLGYPEVFVFFLMWPIFFSNLLTGLVNSVCHMADNKIAKILFLTYRPHDSQDDSCNSAILGPITMGLGYHNNHHMKPWKYNNAEKWWEVDPSKWIIGAIRK